MYKNKCVNHVLEAGVHSITRDAGEFHPHDVTPTHYTCPNGDHSFPNNRNI